MEPISAIARLWPPAAAAQRFLGIRFVLLRGDRPGVGGASAVRIAFKKGRPKFVHPSSSPTRCRVDSQEPVELQQPPSSSQVTVRILSSSYVRPARPTDIAKSYTLTPLDRLICFAQPLKRIVFYKRPSSSASWESVVRRLKESLSDALVSFYPFAARLRRRESDGQVEVLCDDSGVEFVEAEVDATLDDLAMGELPEQDLFYLAPGHQHESMLTAVHPWTSQTPPLAVQVTRFACGGFSIGLACLHQMVDATCVWHFLHSWSLIASGNRARVVEPRYSQRLLRRDPDKHYNQLPSDYTILSRAGVGGGMTVTTELETKVFHFTADAVLQMKQEAASAWQEGLEFTAYEVLVGHVWQRVVAARDLPESEETRFVLPMSVRNRSIPGAAAAVVERFKCLPATYFGNAVAYSVVRPVSAGELCAGDAAFCAGLVRDAKASYDADALQCLINVGDGIDASLVLLLSCLLLPHTFIVGDSHSTPAYEADFGWGRPECVRYADLYNAPNVLLLLAGKQPGSASIQICALKHHMARLQADPLFRGRCSSSHPRVQLLASSGAP